MSFIKHALITLFFLAVIGLASALWVIIGGRFDVASSAELPQPIHDLIHQTRVNAVRREARDLSIELPDLDDETLMFEAVVGFESMCADCHHPPGASPSALAQGLNPPPADLTESAGKRSTEELFWVTKHGIRMSGMPAWGPTHSDDELLPVVALIERFPAFADHDYGELLAAAEAAGIDHDHDHDHHGEGHDHGHHHNH